MNIYKITWGDNELGNCIAWASSKAEAKKYVSRLKKHYKGETYGNSDTVELLERGFEIRLESFPKNKKAVIDWLNEEVVFDNDPKNWSLVGVLKNAPPKSLDDSQG